MGTRFARKPGRFTEQMAKERPWAGSTARYGAAGESAAWSIVYDLYLWDRMEEAYAAVEELGAGSGGHGLVGYRTIEGEFLTRKSGSREQYSDWLTVEAIESESPFSLDELGLIVTETVDHVAAGLGFEHGAPVMVSVMARESDIPWMPGRFGYCIDKFPFDKVCIPNYSLYDPEDLRSVLMHEYSHVVALNTSLGRCPLWLDEAIAMAMGGGADRRSWASLASGRWPWLGIDELEGCFGEDRESEPGQRTVWMAYQQSAVLGAYLESLEGTEGLGRLLKGFANNSVLQDLWLRVSGARDSDEALKEVYGIGSQALFERAHSWLVGRLGGSA